MSEEDGVFSFDESTGYWLRRVYLAISEALQSRLDEYDVTVAQWPVLSSLHSGVSQTPGELAAHIGVDRSAITRLLDRLEKKGLVTRVESETDGRSVRIRLTTRGEALVPGIAQLSKEVNAKFLGGISEEKIRQMEHTLRLMSANADS